jgi:hypothetical protein
MEPCADIPASQRAMRHAAPAAQPRDLVIVIMSMVSSESLAAQTPMF